jgi:hypothetical protein
MKKQINPTRKAHLLRAVFCLLLLLSACAIPFALAQPSSAKRNLAEQRTIFLPVGTTIPVGATPTPTPTCLEIMYGGNGNGQQGRGALIIIDQTNGTGTLVGTPVPNVGLSGIAFDPDGRLFASTVTTGNPSTLIQIDPDTGTLISTIGTIVDNGMPISIGDLSFRPETGVLYGISSNAFSGGGKLYTLNLSTAAATLVGDTGTGAGGGLAFAPDGTLYLFAVFSLNIISPEDGHVISSIEADNPYDGLGLRHSDGVLFAGPGGSDAVYTIDASTGFGTLIGHTGQGNVSDIDFRVSGQCPTPTPRPTPPRPTPRPRLRPTPAPRP